MTDWKKSRNIATRLVVTGALRLLTPAHLGNGEEGNQIDMLLIRDGLDSRLPLLTGSSIAGALRSYLQAYEKGFFERERREDSTPSLKHDGRESAVALLFGGVKGDDDGEQSPLIVDDALGMPFIPEVRDGVKIDPTRRTALDKAKFDTEFLPTETIFSLRFELLLPADHSRAERLKAALVCALAGFERSEIPIGARRTRGFGKCVVDGWWVTAYDLRSTAGLLAWIEADPDAPRLGAAEDAQKIADALHVQSPDHDQRSLFTIEATFELDSPLLIRAEQPLIGRLPDIELDITDDEQPDFIHIRDAAGHPILPGTSLAGALRARAQRILNTVNRTAATDLLDGLFGRDMHAGRGDPTASRLVVSEARVDLGSYLVQNRVAIDRFTGGALDTALFSEAPQVGGSVTLTLTIRDHPKLKAEQRAAEKGVLLLLLKDLWTGDLALGGTSSIGRGRLRGVRADITEYDRINDTRHAWHIATAGPTGKLVITSDPGSDQKRLNDYVTAIATVPAREVRDGAHS